MAGGDIDRGWQCVGQARGARGRTHRAQGWGRTGQGLQPGHCRASGAPRHSLWSCVKLQLQSSRPRDKTTFSKIIGMSERIFYLLTFPRLHKKSFAGEPSFAPDSGGSGSAGTQRSHRSVPGSRARDPSPRVCIRT